MVHNDVFGGSSGVKNLHKRLINNTLQKTRVEVNKEMIIR
jgi:hypothetical protein